MCPTQERLQGSNGSRQGDAGLVAASLSNSETAERLYDGEATVKTHGSGTVLRSDPPQEAKRAL
jgi:DNA-binding NarL/FixJ family response regulator